MKVGVEIDPSQFFTAVKKAVNAFPAACGRRVGYEIETGYLRTSHVFASDATPVSDLFQPPQSDTKGSVEQ